MSFRPVTDGGRSSGLAERMVVAHEVAGSSPVAHPIDKAEDWKTYAQLAELVDAAASKAATERCGSSNLPLGTTQ